MPVHLLRVRSRGPTEGVFPQCDEHSRPPSRFSEQQELVGWPVRSSGSCSFSLAVTLFVCKVHNMHCANTRLTSPRPQQNTSEIQPAIYSNVRRGCGLHQPPWASVIIGTELNNSLPRTSDRCANVSAWVFHRAQTKVPLIALLREAGLHGFPMTLRNSGVLRHRWGHKAAIHPPALSLECPLSRQ
jgi:hypothetical protein